MNNYRIVQIFSFEKNKTIFIVQKRRLWGLIWFEEGKQVYGLQDYFLTYTEAFLEINKRKGKVLYLYIY